MISLSIQQGSVKSPNNESTKLRAEVMKCLNEHKTHFCEDTTHSSEVMTGCVGAIVKQGKIIDVAVKNKPQGDPAAKTLHVYRYSSATVMLFSSSMRKYAHFKDQFKGEFPEIHESASESGTIGDFQHFSAYCQGRELSEIDSNISNFAKDLHTKIMFLVGAREKHDTHLVEYEENKVGAYDARDKILEELIKTQKDHGSDRTGFTVILFEHSVTSELDQLFQSEMISDQVAQEIIEFIIRAQSEIMFNSQRSVIQDKSEILPLLKDASLIKWIEGTESPESEKEEPVEPIHAKRQ
ncbi:hypothetical protein RF11_01982 [Thelohanellus kitauei]|uniref:Uncharacterized protein n=1 Tax=Thelohanellus kitauei TaxID=669202 RepID=A0A0C2ML87_THEKT|nr:hypothetical protein RF11_01982 [Thelohanellus kitauei]